MPAAIANALGIIDIGDGTLDEKLRMAVRDRRMLLLLDNVEQVVDAAPAIRSLLTDAPHLAVLATSRILLRVSGEHGVELGPLALPDMRHGASVGRALPAPSVSLFVERVRAAKPDFELTDDNVEDVERICIALDGVPLAIELAAARARVLTPSEMLDRLDERLLALGGGVRDLPERQRTIRSTIEWSTQLLTPSEQELLARLGLFAGGFTLDAAEWIAEGIPDADTLDDLGALVDGSLVRQQDRGDRAVFSMLSTVREYALEQLVGATGCHGAARSPRAVLRAPRRAGGVRARGPHADRVDRPTGGGGRQPARDGPAPARHAPVDDRRAFRVDALRVLVGRTGISARCRAGCARCSTRATSSTTSPVPRRSTSPGRSPSGGTPTSGSCPGSARARRCSVARASDRARRSRSSPSASPCSAPASPTPTRADEALEASLDLFREAGDTWGEAMALVTSWAAWRCFRQDVHAALARFDESLAVAKRQHDDLGEAIALHHRGWVEVLLGRFDVARECFEESLAYSERLHHDEGVAYATRGAHRRRRRRRATWRGRARCSARPRCCASAPASTTRRRSRSTSSSSTGSSPSPAAGTFEAARARGRHLHVDDAVAFALQRNGADAAASPS